MGPMLPKIHSALLFQEIIRCALFALCTKSGDKAMEKEKITSQIRILVDSLRRMGVSEQEIEEIISPSKEGRITLTAKGLSFPDNGGAFTRLTPMERSLYILLLKTPQGISAEDFWRYSEELSEIYFRQTASDDPDVVRDAVDAICDEDRGTLYTNISRIRRKIISTLGKAYSLPYLITRGSDGAYGIPIPRELVEGL